MALGANIAANKNNATEILECLFLFRALFACFANFFLSLTKFETTFVHTRFQSLRCYKNTEIQGLMEMRMDVFFPQ